MQVTPASFSLKVKCLTVAISSSAILAPQMVQAADVKVISPAEAKKAALVHVMNFEQVSPGLLRGGAPSALALRELKDAGVKTIVNLRGGGAGSTKEERAAKEIGLDYYNIPMGYADPNLTKVSSVLDILRDPEKQPVYLHCMHGADRTGMIVGIQRVTQDGWQFDRAYSEMRGHHFKPFLIAMRKTVQAFASGKYTYVEHQGISIAGVAARPASTKIAQDKPL